MLWIKALRSALHPDSRPVGADDGEPATRPRFEAAGHLLSSIDRLIAFVPAGGFRSKSAVLSQRPLPRRLSQTLNVRNWPAPCGHERRLRRRGTRKRPARASASFGEARQAGLGRVLPTADVGYAVAQLGGQLSGGEIARPTGAGRPCPDIRRPQGVTPSSRLRGRFSSSLRQASAGRGTRAASRRINVSPLPRASTIPHPFERHQTKCGLLPFDREPLQP